ncbi:hypothetical protein [Vibrio alginolyticus]|uniref:hypothetical protein n=1 Tax=Vibrio alginolyticus TaxID=663 RepID=UPI002022E773|nr:hypothetical protein [Vibrio alginolyticus]
MDTKQISTVIIILVLSALVVAYLKLTTVSNAIHKPTTIGISKTALLLKSMELNQEATI